MFDERILTLIPKMYFPNSIFFGQKGLTVLNSIKNKTTLFIVSKSFKTHNIQEYEELVGDSPNVVHSGEPTLSDVETIKNKATSVNPEIVIAIGGGSVIDLVKAVKHELNLPMIAIPTTIGSGTEVSPYSVLIDETTSTKKILSFSDLLPESVIIDARFYQSLSTDQIVIQSIDAFAHGLEALVSRISNYFSDTLALTSIDNLYRHLMELTDEYNPELLEKIKIDTTLAGLAQGSAATGLAHSFAHYFGTKNNIPHAEAIATFLLDVVELNMPHTDKYKKLDTLKSMTSDNIVQKLNELFDTFGIKNPSIELKEEKETIAEKIRRDICTLSNPFAPKAEDIVVIIDKHI